MDWTEICITVGISELEKACAIVSMVSSAGLLIEDYSDIEQGVMEVAHIDLIDADLLNKDRATADIKIYIPIEESPDEYIKFIGSQCEQSGIEIKISACGVMEEDWATAWKAYYHPIELSDKLAICPSWESYTPKDGQQVITLDPGMAFGTGTHETTRLCLEILEKYLKPGSSMLDIGCGSGILSIAAKALGSGRTVGIDIDPVAVRVANENAACNSFGDIEFICGDLAADISGKFDIVCANIVADVIIRLAPELGALMNDDGVCVLSGIIDERKDDIIWALMQSGLVPFHTVEKNGWVAIAAGRTE